MIPSVIQIEKSALGPNLVQRSGLLDHHTSSRPRRALRFLLAGGFVLVAWFALLAVATVVGEPKRVVVFAPAADAIRALVRGDALILGGGNGFTVMHGRKRGFVRALYAGGAWLVLPATTGGCRGMATGPAVAAGPSR